MAQRKPIFQLKADYDPKDLLLVKLQQTYADGRTVKRDIPSTDGVSIESVLYCIREYQELTQALNFDTGPELFNNFRRILCEMIGTQGPNRTVTSPIESTVMVA
jgi:hypothetical protein